MDDVYHNGKKVKYLVEGGYVHSPHDNQEHYVTEDTLMRLYKAKRSQCVRMSATTVQERETGKYDSLIKLMPSYTGNYTLPTK